jgi:hypothetical protein
MSGFKESQVKAQDEITAACRGWDSWIQRIISYPAVNEKRWYPEMLLTLGVLLFNEVDKAKIKSYISSTTGGVSGVGRRLEETELASVFPEDPAVAASSE